MSRFGKCITGFIAAGLLVGGGLATPLAASAATEGERSLRAPAGPCNIAPQMVFKKGRSGNLYWYTLQNCYSNSVRVQVHAMVFGSGWSPCQSIAAGRTASYSGSVNPFDSWRYC
ncbi:hypothetical protein ACO0E1_15265 [Curtobacterium sp. RRHDQ66]|uniref:hypothetical protein n=1 Tax=Curtobacterium guangdongense TaxID=3413380 RepID=UPI003BEFC452